MHRLSRFPVRYASVKPNGLDATAEVRSPGRSAVTTSTTAAHRAATKGSDKGASGRGGKTFKSVHPVPGRCQPFQRSVRGRRDRRNVRDRTAYPITSAAGVGGALQEKHRARPRGGRFDQASGWLRPSQCLRGSGGTCPYGGQEIPGSRQRFPEVRERVRRMPTGSQ